MQGNKLYVGNLPYSIVEDDLEELFSKYGTVVSVNIITDHDTGKAKGFAFVQMSILSEAEKAKRALNGSDFQGRALKVEESRAPRNRESTTSH